jgi:hypothetical protein
MWEVNLCSLLVWRAYGDVLYAFFIMGLIAYFMPGNDLGSFESLYDLLLMTFIFFFLSVFGYSLFGMLVKFMLHSVWRAILDNFCPIAVWASSLEIHYFASTSFGEV